MEIMALSEVLRQEVVSKYLEQGNRLAAAGDSNGATQQFRTALAVDPQNANVAQRLHDVSPVDEDPDHKHVLQSFVWQNLDLAPRFPALTKFLDFWERNLDGKVHRVKVANAALIKPAEFKFASGLYALH